MEIFSGTHCALTCVQQRKKDILKAVSVVGDIMKKFDAFLYLSSVSAGIGLIGVNLFSVLDVSDYQPAIFSETPAQLVMPVTDVAPPASVAAECADCAAPTPRAEMAGAARPAAGRLVSNRELLNKPAAVLPVTGAGVHR